MLEILLILILIVLYLIYRGVSKSFGSNKNEEGLYEKEYTRSYSVKGMLGIINDNLHEVTKGTERIADYYDAEYPAGLKSNNQKRKNSLIKIYADHLTKVEKMSPKYALVRARFEITNFYDTDKIIDKINEAIDWSEREKYELDYHQTNILADDIKRDLEHLASYYIYAPVYEFLVKQHHYKGITDLKVEFLGAVVDEDYYNYVRNRAIVHKLEQLKIIKKIDDGKGIWNVKPKFKFLVTDPEKIKVIVYGGGSSHDNGYFEEQYREGRLERIFVSYDEY